MLAQLKIILKEQFYLDPLDRYFNSHVEDFQKKGQPLYLKTLRYI